MRAVRPEDWSIDPRVVFRDRRIGIALVLIPSSIAHPPMYRGTLAACCMPDGSPERPIRPSHSVRVRPRAA